MSENFVSLTALQEDLKTQTGPPNINLKTVKPSGFFPRLDGNKVAFVTQPSMFRAYTGTRINAATQVYPIQAFLWLSAYVKKLIPGIKTVVCDLGVRDVRKARCWKELIQFFREERPKYICLTVTTPVYYEAKLVGIIAKQVLGPEAVIVHGGVHASALWQESLNDSMCDAVVIGEGEMTFGEICQGRPLKEIHGIAYREDDRRYMSLSVDEIIRRLENGEEAYYIQKDAVISIDPLAKRTLPRPFMTTQQLDDLPFQDLELYDVRRYRNPPIVAKTLPVLQFETSRGCPAACDFCSAEDKYRVLSPNRVIEEMKFYQRFGIRTIRISDDQFLTDVRRGEIIAEKMLQAGLHFDINLGNGVRADRCTRKFLELFKRAGLYQAGAGFESGDQATLDSMQKGLDIQKSLEVVHLFRELDIELVGFFIFGAEAETFQSMQRTLDFAKKLLPTFAKVTIYTPFPDTQAYARWDRQGRIISKRWDHYNIHKAAGVYRHPNPELTPETLTAWYRKFYRDYYTHWPYIRREVGRSWQDGSWRWKTTTALRTFFPSVFRTSPMDNVNARYFDDKREKLVTA